MQITVICNYKHECMCMCVCVCVVGVCVYVSVCMCVSVCGKMWEEVCACKCTHAYKRASMRV